MAIGHCRAFDLRRAFILIFLIIIAMLFNLKAARPPHIGFNNLPICK